MEAEHLFPAEAVRADLTEIWHTLLDVSAAPFSTSSRATVENLYRRTLGTIVAPLTSRQAWLTISPVLAALHDGHIGVAFPEPLNSEVFSTPVLFSIADERVVVSRDVTQTIPIGSRVAYIEGMPADRYRATVDRCFGAQTSALQNIRFTHAGPWAFVALFGARPSYSIEWLDENGRQRKSIVGSHGGLEHRAPRKRAAYEYRTLHGGTVGLLQYRRCVDLAQFETFLQAMLAQIAARPIKGLIIDVRENSGGDSALSDLLWLSISEKAFRQYRSVTVMASTLVKAEYGRSRYIATYGERAWHASQGTLITTDVALIHPSRRPGGYTGPVYLLISKRTFSAGMSCAAAARDYALATVIGQETAEPVDGTSEVYERVTTHLRLSVDYTTSLTLGPARRPKNQGVVPNIVIETTAADRIAGKDPVLTAALQMISRH